MYFLRPRQFKIFASFRRFKTRSGQGAQLLLLRSGGAVQALQDAAQLRLRIDHQA